MAQTQTQIAAARAAAAYHLELRLLALPAAPQRSGPLQLPAAVSACYRSPVPLLLGSQVVVALQVALAADPPPPGGRHLPWLALRSGLLIEVLANGDLTLLTPVDGGVASLPGPQCRPVLVADAPPPDAAMSGWRRFLRLLWR